ncbi:cytochrome P450 [Dactylonectria macrodidyma]|uniref:Cytochrome P450 n=1 Tax=Dactylonectria macrodidyma TaxID=307937 RepID=A0A9P9DRC8_9HYPO|nr:cytochrome P450 [Dactylonectria macrodidyma]
MLREIAYALLGVVVLAYALEWSLSLFDDPREPPRIVSCVPLIGHLLGMVRYGVSYFNTTSKQTRAEIYTINIFNAKLYISNTQRLIPLVQKASKTLSFRPFMQTATKLLGDVTDETYELFGGELVDKFSQAMRTSLAPGPHLDEQNMRMGRRALIDVDALVQSTSSGSSTKISLLQWTRHIVMQASSCGVYGQEHPFRNPKVEAAFWTWETHIAAHMTKTDITRKGYAAREIVFDAFREYYKVIPEDASLVVCERLRVLREGGVCEEDVCKQEATFGTAIYANTAPTMYWTIYELFSRPGALQELRDEISREAVSGTKEEGFVLDVAALKTKCTLLLSVLQETQRTRHIFAMIRKVMSDTLLDGQYMLKAGHYLQMPGNPIHTNTSVWGPTAGAFDPYRFMPQESGDRKARDPSSFVAWGAPPHLCPARQFAATEIMIIVALLAMRVDIEPVGGDEWERSPALETGEFVSVYNPKKDIKVEVGGREQWRSTWTLKMGESKTRISLASG